VQLITYIMPNKLKTHVEQRVVKEVVRGIIPPGESDIWDGVALLVPPLSPCNIHISGRLIKVDYCVEMVLELPLPWKHLRVTLPITIGSVPLRSDFKSFMPPPLTIEKQRPLPKINYSEFPLYSFSECFFGRETMEAQYERLTGDVDDIGPQYEPLHPFAPSYITYTLGKMVDASQLKDIDTRPSTADQRRRSSDRASVSKGSKNGSRDSKGSRGSKGSDGNQKRELDSKEQLAMSVINKISSESLKIRSEWLKNRRQ
ncbi:Arrestin C-terminal-like domain, partial [Trinorchestia longiramus]